jgi:hypothetical protein
MTDPIQRAAAVASKNMLRDEVQAHRALRTALRALLHTDDRPGGGAAHVHLADDEPDYTPPLLAVAVADVQRLLDQHAYPAVGDAPAPGPGSAFYGATGAASADGIEQVLMARIGVVLRTHRNRTATAEEIRTRLIVRYQVAPTILTIVACLGVLAATGYVEQTNPHGPYIWTDHEQPDQQAAVSGSTGSTDDLARLVDRVLAASERQGHAARAFLPDAGTAVNFEALGEFVAANRNMQNAIEALHGWLAGPVPSDEHPTD